MPRLLILRMDQNCPDTSYFGGLRGEVLGWAYALIRLGDTRVILFDKAPYEDRLGREPPAGFLHDVYEVDDFDAQIARLRAAGVRFLMEPQRRLRSESQGSLRVQACA
jgi:uncharacterized glyoxalase superfamily protein PhnB